MQQLFEGKPQGLSPICDCLFAIALPFMLASAAGAQTNPPPAGSTNTALAQQASGQPEVSA